MRTSQIVIPLVEQEPTALRSTKLVNAYRKERTQQEVTEVELNRSNIVMIDENGNIKKVPILAEH
ncbi:hypothetical protein TW81_06355 [Vibrio galatheae]|uniref:Uncharacterized protein n=1 Tax=Vibrio galatheae TaxID=579748 RepID=A0A0F4NLG1_9VIBR|nr:hypothetical protein [Vibrio galatheae]KJY84030.1 hypothetical protein TW81_06355 [Vibrio galatheae]